jgi:hypothetical protein
MLDDAVMALARMPREKRNGSERVARGDSPDGFSVSPSFRKTSSAFFLRTCKHGILGPAPDKR